MCKKTVKKDEEVIIHIPVELFEEAGIQCKNGYAMYCRDGEIVIKELIDDEDEYYDDNENDECNDHCIEGCEHFGNPSCGSEEKGLDSIIISISFKDPGSQSSRSLLFNIDTAIINGTLNKLTEDDQVGLGFCLSLSICNFLEAKSKESKQ